MYLPASAACQLVPQAAMLMLDASVSSSSGISFRRGIHVRGRELGQVVLQLGQGIATFVAKHGVANDLTGRNGQQIGRLAMLQEFHGDLSHAGTMNILVRSSNDASSGQSGPRLSRHNR